MKGLSFLFAVHNHQPVGNFDDVFERAFADCYHPFLSTVADYPYFKFALHFSGPLWDRLRDRERESWALIERMSERGQVELLGGGYYEPVLAVIPERDRAGQIDLQSDFLETHFGRRPRGLWLTERVWEPQLAGTLARRGVEYTLLDEEHFRMAGVDAIHADYVTEDEGLSVRLFPIDKTLRYLIPFRPLDEVRAALERIAEAGGTAILGDDGEKFGLWPGTKAWVYEGGWLRRFLEFVGREGIRTRTFAEHLDDTAPAGRVYLPPASYEEMMDWALEPRAYGAFKALKAGAPSGARRFLRGGGFREFFLKYPEAGHLQARMLGVSADVARHPGSGEARTELYKAQCNDPYWHGVFGGLYLPHLRASAYRHLLAAEAELPQPKGWRVRDFDLDGRPEIVWRGTAFQLFLDPGEGGSLVECDVLSGSRNIGDVLSRRPESYHTLEDAAGEDEGASIHELKRRVPPEAADVLRYDRHRRSSLLDHFLPPDTAPDGFRRLEYEELGDFIAQAYDWAIEGGAAVLTRRGRVLLDGESLPVRVTKRVQPGEGAVRFSYRIVNESARCLRALFAPETNVSVFPFEFEAADGRAVFMKRIVWEASAADALWHFPLRTLSQSEGGYDIIHQGVCLAPIWRLDLKPGETAAFEIVLEDCGTEGAQILRRS
jgi:alpha-amylase